MKRDGGVLPHLLGQSRSNFCGSAWPTGVKVFRADRAWFRKLLSIDIFRDPRHWLDRAPRMTAFGNNAILARSEARRRYARGESIYLLGLDMTVPRLRDLCDGLAADLAVNPADVTVEAWAAGGPTSVGMHFDLDYNFNLQVIGRKTWWSAPNDFVANPVRSHHAAWAGTYVASQTGRELPTQMPANARMWHARPGDVVYLPQGVWHATRTAGATFAMAFVIRPPTLATHIMQTLVERLHADTRWRRRVLGARDAREHARLKAAARDALAAAKETLAHLGPADVLYRSLWGREPEFYRKRDEVVECRLDAAAGKLTWRRGHERHEVRVHPRAIPAGEYIAKASTVWSIAALHDLVANDAAPLVSALVTRMVDDGLLEAAPVGSGGVAAVQHDADQ